MSKAKTEQILYVFASILTMSQRKIRITKSDSGLNALANRTIEVQENQKVIDTGLYGIVRHPMYGVTLLLFLSMPIVLGSLYAFVIFLAYPFIIAKRIRHEKAFLEKELDGYREYKQRVKYRLIPFIW